MSNNTNPELQVYVAVEPLNLSSVALTIPLDGLDNARHWPIVSDDALLFCGVINLQTYN